MELAEPQLDTLRHMLGINDPSCSFPRPYRNHYCANPGDPYMAELARIGAVRLLSGPGECIPYDVYCCTEAGRTAAIESHKRIRWGKARRRYHLYLSIKDVYPDLTFQQFLQDPEFREARDAC